MAFPIIDSFNRQDSVTGTLGIDPQTWLGITPVGSAQWLFWANGGGIAGWGIISNAAMIIASGGFYQGTYVNTGTANGILTVTGPGACFRFNQTIAGPGGFFIVNDAGSMRLAKMINGFAPVYIASLGATVPTTIEVDCFGDQNNIYFDGTLALSFTDSFNDTAVGFGLAATVNDTRGSRWTNFSFSGSNVLVHDSFTDTNGTLITAHTPDVRPNGNPWIGSDGGTGWIIDTNQMLDNAAGGPNDDGVRIDSGSADFVMQVTLANIQFGGGGSNQQIWWRMGLPFPGSRYNLQISDQFPLVTSNAFQITNPVGLIIFTGFIPIVMNPGDILQVYVIGTTIKFVYQGIILASFTDPSPSNTLSSISGLGAHGVNFRYDDFFVFSPPILIASDNFTRNDNPSLGFTDTGDLWSYIGIDAWFIESNEAQLFWSGPGNNAIAFVDAGRSDLFLRCVVAVPSTGWSIRFRFVDGGDNWFFTQSGASWNLFTVSGGVPTLQGNVPIAINPGDVITILLNGPQITIKQNNTLLFNISSSFLVTATKFGISGDNNAQALGGGGAEWEDFSLSYTPLVVQSPMLLFDSYRIFPAVNSATFCFSTNWFGNTRANFFIPSQTGREFFDPTLVKDHFGTIKGLQPNTTYNFEISSDLPDGTKFIINFGSFPTLKSEVIASAPDPLMITKPNHRVLRWDPVVQNSTGQPEILRVSIPANQSGSSTIGINFPNTQTQIGYTVGNNGLLLKTTDGGFIWNALTSPIPGQGWVNVFFIDINTGWVCGSGGTMIHTVDGGQTWTIQTTGVGVDIFDLFFADANNGWAVCDTGVILMTVNGGATWTNSTPPPAMKLIGITFGSPLIGFAVGTGGTILKTTNGGGSWTQIPSGVGFELHAVSVNTSYNQTQIVYVAGDQIILKSIDGGNTFAPITNPSPGDTFTDISFADNLTGIVTDPVAQSIFRTTNGGNSWINFIISQQPNRRVYYTPSNLDTTFFGTDGPGIFIYTNKIMPTFEVYRSEKDNGQNRQLVKAEVVADMFLRPTGTPLVQTDTFQQWQILQGGFQILGFQAINTNGSDLAVVDTKFSDAKFNVRYNSTDQGGIVFRFSDVNNYWRIVKQSTFIRLQKVVNGVVTTVASAFFPPVSSFNVTAIANIIKGGTNGNTLFSTTDIFNETATGFGVISLSNIHKWNQFTVQEIPTKNVFIDFAQRSDILFYNIVAVTIIGVNIFRSLPSETLTDLAFPNISDKVGEEFMQVFGTLDNAQFDSGKAGV